MREIKFRGRTIEGEIVYGDLIQSLYNGKIVYEIRTTRPSDCRDWASYPRYKTIKDSIAQLVGHDEDGNEVYEGDVLVDNLGNQFTAELQSISISGEGFMYDIPPESLKLKKEKKTQRRVNNGE